MKNMDFEQIPLAPEQCVTGFGTTLIVAPHADDESLGCGGIIALMRKFNQDVFILLLSDGTLSHPNSTAYPKEKLRDLRESELIKAGAVLQVPSENIIFCRYRDRSVPSKESKEFEPAVQKITKLIEMIKPTSIFVPWRRDPHPDHRAAYEIITASNTIHAKTYEYPIWMHQIGTEEEAPNAKEVMPFRINISSVLDLKQKAIAAHESQITDLITDDPEGFKLSNEMLDQFNVPYETFFISK